MSHDLSWIPDGLIRHVGIAVVTAGVLGVFFAVLDVRNRARPPALLRNGRKRIAPGGVIVRWTIIGGILFAVLGLGLLLNGELLAGTIFTLIGLVCSVPMIPSLTDWHDVLWDESGIEGPCRMLGPTLGRARTMISWSDIGAAGEARGFMYVQALDGRRIYWSYLSPGYAGLVEEVAQRRSDLFATGHDA